MIRLLIVDDEKRLLKNIASYLRSFDGEFEVSTAETAEEALEILDQREVDVMLTDVRLPGMDGISLVRKVAALQPDLRILVMTAFGGTEIRTSALGAGAVHFVEKPLDLDELKRRLLEAGNAGGGWSGRLGGLDIFDFAQLLALSGKSKIVIVSSGDEKGALRFEKGQLVHASTGRLGGAEAFFTVSQWAAGSIVEVPANQKKRYPANVGISATHLMMEAARLRDEARRPTEEERSDPEESEALAEPLGASADQGFAEEGAEGGESLWSDEAGILLQDGEAAPPVDSGAPDYNWTKEVHMAIQDLLNELASVNGFKGAAVFTAQGEMLEAVTTGSMDIKTTGMYANNALLNAQKATDQMGVGRGNFMQIRAPQAMVLMRCLNEATDFAMTAAGKAHFHTVVVLDPEGNVGMAGMILDKIVAKIADHVR